MEKGREQTEPGSLWGPLTEPTTKQTHWGGLSEGCLPTARTEAGVMGGTGFGL